MALPAISLRQLRAFATIARLGSVRRAASELNVSQPSLSQSLRLLEDVVGCQLLVRDPRGSTVTEAGRQLLSTCENIFESLEFTLDTLHTQSGRPGQPLRVAALPSMARQIVLPAYRSFCALGGTSQLFIRDAIGEEVVRMVRAREVEFALSAPPVVASDLVVKPILRSPMRVVTAQGHSLANGATWRALSKERFIFVARNSQTYDIVTAAFHAAKCFPRNYVETHTAETAARMAAEGMGITVLHARNIDEIEHYGFAHASVREPETALPIALIRLANRTLPKSTAAFWDRLVETASSFA